MLFWKLSAHPAAMLRLAVMQKLDRQTAFTGTKDVAEPLRFDPARLEAYLTREVAGFAGPLTVKQFKGGQSNPTYLLETPSRRYVLRRKPPGKLLPSAHAVDREFRVISALHAQGFPAAEPVIYCADESVAGTAFYVMGFVAGRVFWNPEMPGSNPAERAAVYDAMNATIARLHSLDPAQHRPRRFRPRRELRGASGRALVEAVPRVADAADRRDGAADRMAARASAARRTGAAGARRLPARQHDPRRRTAPKVLAVLDWELSTLGDPLADFTYHLMQWHMPQEDSGGGTGSLLGFDLASARHSAARGVCGRLRRANRDSIRGRI